LSDLQSHTDIVFAKHTIKRNLTVTSHDMDQHDQYEEYEERFNPLRTDRQARRARKPKIKHTPKKAQHQVIEDIADPVGLEEGFHTTYQPSKYESGWLLQSLESLYDQQYITDVLALVKGGKEASVYRCVAHDSTGETLLAAKVYRPRMFRQLRNDHMYREGRDIFMSDGTRLTGQDDRELRAIAKGTAFGQELQHTSWLMHEHKTLQRLYEAGAAVPRPWAIGNNVILMGYIGDETLAAPTLNTVRLEADEAVPLFQEVLRNVELMLQLGLVHADLSAYNVLYWEGEITLIDFPQVTDLHANRNVGFILRRDITRVCEYFAQRGVECDPVALADDLWYRYGRATPEDLLLGDDPLL
jgi:RIO kinase 1